MKKFLKYFLLTLVIIVIVFFLIGLIKPVQECTIITTVNAPVEKTFAIMNDTSKLNKWLAGFKSMEQISGNLYEKGSKWKVIFLDDEKEIVMTETITGFKQNEMMSFNISNDFISSDNDITFTPKENATEITAYVTYHGMKLYQKSILAFFSGSILKTQKENYDALKRLVENN